jgi:2-polyprenyl-6-methoxyphenol hydroxylase-like FAD-dependent oxidoreductase
VNRRFDGDVLVVGTDAVALALACDLHRAGVMARVVAPVNEAVEAPRWLPVGLRPPALEVLSDLGVRDEVVARGAPIARAQIVVEGAGELQLDLLPVGVPWGTPPVLTPREVLEDALAVRLEELGGAIDGDARVVDVSLGGGGVYALEVARGGARRTSRWRYVVDTTGATLPSLGIGFRVHHRGRYLAAALDGPQPHGVVTSFLGVGRAGGMVLPSVGELPPVAVAEIDAGASADLAFAFEALGAGARSPRPRDAPVAFEAFDGIAERYREGRVLLAGRAAHRHGHLDVETTNGGLDDAHGLAWKLARVVRGVAPPALLDTHEAERRPVAEARLLRTVRERRLLRAAPNMSFSRRDVLLRALHDAFARGRMQQRWQILAAGAPERSSGAGARVPNAICRSMPDGAEVEIAEVLSGAHFTLLARVDHGRDDAAARAAGAVRRALGDDVGVVAVARASVAELPWADWTLVDAGGATERLGLDPGGVVLVRPDRRVAYAGPADPARLLDALGPICEVPLAPVVPLRTAL